MQRRSPARASRRDDDEHERSRPTTSRRGTSGRAGDARIVRWAVVGIGHIAQVAVLPAFRNARANSRLVALISGDGEKLARIGRRYRVEHVGSYDDFEHVAAAAGADAVYIALPNHLHAEYTERAAAAGLHVLCEKPMAVTTQE